MVLKLGRYLFLVRVSLISRRRRLTWAFSSTPKNDIEVIFITLNREGYTMDGRDEYKGNRESRYDYCGEEQSHELGKK